MKNKNVLFVLCDQLNASVLDIYGGALQTTHIKRLAGKSMIFDTAYCQTPLCTPSRASMITGQYPYNHGIVSNVMRIDYPTLGGPITEQGITNQDQTTEKLLWEQGYQTAHYGKWHLSGENLSYYPDMYREHYEYETDMEGRFAKTMKLPRENWMDWYGWKLPTEVTDSFQKSVKPYCQTRLANSSFSDFISKMGRLCMEPSQLYDYKVADKCITFLESCGDSPFMLTCSFNTPHDPNVIPAPYYDRIDPAQIECDATALCEEYFNADLSKALPAECGNDFLKEFLRIYYASILFLDDQIGRVLDALRKTGKEEDTIIVFVADHGDMAGGHGMFWKSTSAFYDEVARVPFLIKSPAQIPVGRFTAPVELIDVMPTLLELCGVDSYAKIDGKSLVPFLTGKKDTKDMTALSMRLNWNEGHTRERRNYREQFSFMLRDAAYKYSIYKKGDSLQEFLYCMEDDPQETCNLTNSASHLDTKEAMKQKLKKRLADTGCRCGILSV